MNDIENWSYLEVLCNVLDGAHRNDCITLFNVFSFTLKSVNVQFSMTELKAAKAHCSHITRKRPTQ